MKSIAKALVCCLLISLPITTVAQTRRSSRPDAAQLRSRFLAAFGNDFDLVKDEFRSRSGEQGGGEYWLAYVKPTHAGYFGLQYRFKPNDNHNSHVEHEIFFGVGPRGCRRGPPSSGVYTRFCLGDTVIVPVLVNRFTEHEFKLAKSQPLRDEDWQTFEDKYPEIRDQKLDTTPVANPSESLRYVGRGSHKMMHRIPGYTLELYAVFEAVKPGKFNLMASSAPQAEAPGKPAYGSIPIVVVARDTPVTLLAGREETRGFMMRPNGESLSSTSGNNYMTSLIVLQPGDRISVRYLSARRGPQYERRGYARSGSSDPAESVQPVISVHQFALDTKYDYSGWLVDYFRVR
jgi:hypothetical protein